MFFIMGHSGDQISILQHCLQMSDVYMLFTVALMFVSFMAWQMRQLICKSSGSALLGNDVKDGTFYERDHVYVVEYKMGGIDSNNGNSKPPVV
jgi:hypothetical protein